jgi:cell wall-associated NlpC family hydrolase
MQLKKPAFLGLFVLFSAFAAAPQANAQQVQSRPRIAPTNKTNKVSTGVQQRPVGAPANAVVVPNAPRTGAVENTVMSRPVAPSRTTLTNDLMVRPTVSARPVAAAASSSVLAAFRSKLLTAMSSKLGIPYRYGSEGPNTYDCSGLVWTVFTEAGIPFERSSAARFWKEFPEATEEEKKQFGTLIFFNRLGHVGIVIDENTFYHASSSKGVTFSKLEGYWGKRVVGYRRIPLNQLPQLPPVPTAEKAK